MPLEIYIQIYLTNLNRLTKLRQKRIAFAVTNERIRGCVSDGGKLLYSESCLYANEVCCQRLCPYNTHGSAEVSFVRICGSMLGLLMFDS